VTKHYLGYCDRKQQKQRLLIETTHAVYVQQYTMRTHLTIKWWDRFHRDGWSSNRGQRWASPKLRARTPLLPPCGAACMDCTIIARRLEVCYHLYGAAQRRWLEVRGYHFFLSVSYPYLFIIIMMIMIIIIRQLIRRHNTVIVTTRNYMELSVRRTWDSAGQTLQCIGSTTTDFLTRR